VGNLDRRATVKWSLCVIVPPASSDAHARHIISSSGDSHCRCSHSMISGGELDAGQHRRGGDQAATPARQFSSGCRLPSLAGPYRTARPRPRPLRPTPITRYRVTTLTTLSGTLAASISHQLRGIFLVRSHTYEITFSGRAGRTLRAQFDDCQVTTSPEVTTLRAELPDQAALSGLVERIVGLGLEIINVHLVTQPSAPLTDLAHVQGQGGLFTQIVRYVNFTRNNDIST
jgi:hypothetical protein